MRFIIASLDKAKELLTDKDTRSEISAVVSIGDTDQTTPACVKSKKHIRLEFDDLEGGVEKDKIDPPKKSDIQRLINSAPSLLATSGKILCHCSHGIHRSSAAAYILNVMSKDKGKEKKALKQLIDEFPDIHPNRLMIKFAADILDRPEMLKVYDEMF